MVVHLIPKSRLLPRALTLRSLQKPCWAPPRWSVGHTNGSTRFHSSGVHQQQQQQQQQQNSQNKGMRKRWRWRSVLSILDWWCLAAGGWITWRGVLTRWTPLGIVFIVALQWRHRGKKEDVHLATKYEVQCYTTIPLRIFSRCFGWLADCPVPSSLRPIVYGAYSSTFGVNMAEADVEDFKHYRSLAQFFARGIKPEVRPIDPLSCLVVPCDGKILHCGPAESSYIEQVKGVSYRLDCFLGPQTWRQKNGFEDDLKRKQTDTYNSFHKSVMHSKDDTNLYQCVIYLAPGDYHRFHSPTSWKPEFRRHIPGELLSVNPSIARWIPGLFCLNERVHYIGSWNHGFFCFTAVGATNVGSVSVYIDENLKTNKWHGWKYGFTNWTRPLSGQLPENIYANEKVLSSDIQLGKGQLIGHFNMGSTIVLIFEAPKNFKFTVNPGQAVKMGERLGCVGKVVEQVSKDQNDKDTTEQSI